MKAQHDKLRSQATQSAQCVPGRAAKAPGYAAFADVAESTTTKMYDTHRPVGPRRPYKRLSETAHGLVSGLYNDKTVAFEGKYIFEQNTDDLDAVASHVAAWWTTALLMLSAYHGWDADQALKPFTDTWRSLYPSTGN